ncbi:MAG: hypothetical protein WCR86_13545 [Parabacteroides sp.]
MNKIELNIPKLGGVQDFDIIASVKIRKGKNYRYVCTTWDGDGNENSGTYDIYCDRSTGEYVASV